MRENRLSGSMRGRRKRTVTYRACVLLYSAPRTFPRASLARGIQHCLHSTPQPDCFMALTRSACSGSRQTIFA